MKTIKLLITTLVIYILPMLAMDNKQQKEQALLDDFKRAVYDNEITPEFMLKQIQFLDKSNLSVWKLRRIATRQAFCEEAIHERQRYQDSIKNQHEQIKN